MNSAPPPLPTPHPFLLVDQQDHRLYFAAANFHQTTIISSSAGSAIRSRLHHVTEISFCLGSVLS